jgi:hypothetical protein
MSNLSLDSGRLDIDWLSDSILESTGSGIGANGGSGLIEIYYFTADSTAGSTGSIPAVPSSGYPSIKVLLGGL